MAQTPQPLPQQALYGYDVAPASAPPAPQAEPAAEHVDGQRLLEASLIAALPNALANQQMLSHRSCVAKALCTHLSAIAIVNVIVWTIYFAVSRDAYPWPKWVTFGTLLSVAAHAINVLPWTSPRPRKCPRWLQVVISNIVLANVTVWVVYDFTSCEDGFCGYAWPIWVSLPSCVALLVLSVVAATCSK
ncbi:unnamed protein product [Cladocopium goreaui]|uniref:Uncharacterized protein n=1 Tax=Cladocopium goreaui TaxID=2562237 RepID=A0A9P1FQQ9_9DINO|nr:unnamed protein product [Cladocopium goreaui]|mmetsp:Transcript_22272/g.46278  ORF Transcript_22272/g.46278 Transcript_22272/m.46278 type:complete len:189 (-) Transcript_22272:149-715(-)